MHVRVPVSTFALLLVFAAPVQAQWLMAPPTDTVPVLVAGASAEVLTRPTRAVLYAAIAGKDADQGVATTVAASTRERVQGALGRIGIGPDAVTLWGLGMGADLPMGMRGPGRDGAPETLATRFGLRIVVDPIARLDDVLAVLAQAGVEAIPLVRFEVGDDSAARREATERAVNQARVQAETMANAAGVRLGELRTLTTMSGLEEYGPDTRFMQVGYMDRGAALTPSDVRVRVIVQGAWRMLP